METFQYVVSTDAFTAGPYSYPKETVTFTVERSQTSVSLGAQTFRTAAVHRPSNRQRRRGAEMKLSDYLACFSILMLGILIGVELHRASHTQPIVIQNHIPQCKQ